jgi:hypothetical protein
MYYSLSQRTTSLTVNTAAWEVRVAAASLARIVELGFVQTAATASNVGVGRPTAIGVTPTSPQTFVNEGDANAPAALTTAAVAWGTAPTSPAVFLRRADTTGTIGLGTIWTWPRGLVVPAANSVVLFNIATGSLLDAWAVVDE